jgi:hypothetical protein
MARMNPNARCLALLALALLPSCLSNSARIARLYDNLAHEVAGANPVSLPTSAGDARHEKRADEVRSILEQGGELSAEDAFKAAVILVGTDREADLVLAEELAKHSAAMGERRGLRVMAEAVDKRLMMQGAPQMYGTQFAFEFVLDAWRLYPIDPTTTDEVRASVLVPTYAELLAAEDAMNRAHGKKLRGQ